MESERSWVRIHAAEALIAAGEAEAIREYFTNQLANPESSAIRIGVWRVLARTAHSAAERNLWIAKIERAYCEPTSPDRIQAIETLCKLGQRVHGPTLDIVRREAAGAPSVMMVLALWSAQLAEEPHALEGLIRMLGSADPLLRGDAAYALRWLHRSDPAMRQALARAVAVEPADTSAYPYLVAAALTVGADPALAAQWETELKRVLLTGSTDARFEVSQTLKDRCTLSDISMVTKLLADSANDTRVGAAAIILTTLARCR